MPTRRATTSAFTVSLLDINLGRAGLARTGYLYRVAGKLSDALIQNALHAYFAAVSLLINLPQCGIDITGKIARYGARQMGQAVPRLNHSSTPPQPAEVRLPASKLASKPAGHERALKPTVGIDKPSVRNRQL